MPPDDFWSPGPPRRRRRDSEPESQTPPPPPPPPPGGPQSYAPSWQGGRAPEPGSRPAPPPGQHSGPQHGGPQHGGPQHGGPQHGGQHGGPQHSGAPRGGPHHGSPNGAPPQGGPQYGGPQSFPAGPQAYPGPYPQGPGATPQQYGAPQQPPQPGPPGYPPQAHTNGPQSFASGPVYPGTPPAFRGGQGSPPPYSPPPTQPYAAGPAQPYNPPAAAPFSPPAPPYSPPAAPYSPQTPQSYGTSAYGAPAATPYGAPTSPPYGAPTSPSPYGPASYAAPSSYAPQPSYGGGYDTGQTQVFDAGFAAGRTGSTGLIPAYEDEFTRGATARIDFGPHEAFGPPPEDEPQHEPDAAGVFDRFRRIRSHAPLKRKKRRGGIAVVLVLVAFAAAGALRFVPASPWYPKAAQDGVPPPTAAFPFQVPGIDVLASSGDSGTFVSWAYQDLRDGSVNGSVNQAETTPAGSILATWLAADLLSRSAETGEQPVASDLADITSMIQLDDSAATLRVLERVGGPADSITRLISTCGLNDIEPPVLAADAPPWAWLETPISARDAARMGGCVAAGRAAGAEWTPWLLTVMRQVRGDGDFGIREGFDADQRVAIAIKNGVLPAQAGGEWQVNCLAVGDTWSLAVLQRAPATDDSAADLAQLQAKCQQVVRELTGS